MSDRRLRYFKGQLLREQDFGDEQSYHLDRLRRQQRLFYTSGIAEGLTVTANLGAAQVTVSPGTALDAQGRQIVLATAATLPLTGFANQTVLVVISYSEQASDPSVEGRPGETRWWERPQISVVLDNAGAPSADLSIRLARLTFDATGRISSSDASVRTSAGSRGSVPVSEYDFGRRAVATVNFSAPTAASTTPVTVSGLAFQPRFLWVTGAFSAAVTGTTLGGNTYGFAELEGSTPFAQRGTGLAITRLASIPYYQSLGTGTDTGVATFSLRDDGSTPVRAIQAEVQVSSVTASSLTFSYAATLPSGVTQLLPATSLSLRIAYVG